MAKKQPVKSDEYAGTIKSVQKGFEMFLNFSPEAEEKGLIKIVPKELSEIILDVDALLEMISTYVKNKPMAVALHDAEMNQILMTEVEREFGFVAEKDYKAGDQVKFRVSMAYPAVLAALEQEYQICRMKGGAFTTLDKDRVDAAIQRLKYKNYEFLKKWYDMGRDTKGIIPDKKPGEENTNQEEAKS